jgi:single-strand DNA-binding protein
MARSLNRVELIGYAGRDPQMKRTQGGQVVAGFTIGVSRRRKGEGASEETDWFRVVCWDKLAEITEQYLKKGNRIYVDGRLQIRKYTGKDGVERTTAEIVASDLILFSGAPANGKKPAAKGEPYNPTEWLEEVDELGF